MQAHFAPLSQYLTLVIGSYKHYVTIVLIESTVLVMTMYKRLYISSELLEFNKYSVLFF